MKTIPQYVNEFCVGYCPRLKVGWHLTMVINSTYEVLNECFVKPCPGQQGPLPQRFDSGNFVLITRRLDKVRK